MPGKGKTGRLQEERKTTYEMGLLHKRSHGYESTGAEQGCLGQDTGHHSFIGSSLVEDDSTAHDNLNYYHIPCSY